MTSMTTILKLLSSMAPREALLAAIALYQQSHAITLRAEAAGGVDVARRIAAGEAVDIVVLSSDAIDKLIQEGHLSADSRTDLMNSEIAVAVPAGSEHPSLADENAVKNAVVAAASVSYSTGPSGRYLEKLFARWGILESLRPRIIVPPPGVPVARLVASGEVKLGFPQLSELRGAPGIDVVGPLPAQIQQVTTFTAALTTTGSQTDSASAFLAFLASSDLDARKQHHGMTGMTSTAGRS
jgi:molybdate transport system substrate-binding protein